VSLEDAGFETYEAQNADIAIEILKATTDIRLVVTDVDMPGTMDGVKLAHFIRDRWPPIQLIVVSGKVGVRESELPAGARFFGKPYAQQQFMRAVNDMMAGSAGDAA